MSVYPGLTTGVLIRGSGDVFKYSIDKTGRELLFLPIPMGVKKRIKIFIDVLVDRWFRGLAGGILFIFTAVLIWDVQKISLVVVGIVLLWIVLAISIRKQYVNAFRQALNRGEIDPAQLTFKITDASTINSLMKSLDSDNERQISYTLGMLSEVQNEQLARMVGPFLRHQSGEIRRKAVEVLQAQKDDNYSGAIEKLLDDEDPEVRIAALRCIYQQTTRNRLKLLKEYLEHPEFRLRSAALGYIAKYGTEDEKVLIDERLIRTFLNHDGQEGALSRRLLAKALGRLSEAEFHPYIEQLMNDPSAAVVKETIISIGRMKDREFLPRLLQMLSDHQYRAEAREALAAFGDRIIGTLNDYLNDPAVNFSIRRNIPRVLRLIPTQQSVDALTNNLTRVVPELRYPIVRALNHLRTKQPGLNFNREILNSALRQQAQAYYEVYQILHLYREQEGTGEEDTRRTLLKRALAEKLVKSREQMFHLLALQYPAKDIYNAYQGILSDKKTLRASGIEFLENLLQKEAKEFLMPIFEESAPAEIVNRGKRLFKVQINNMETGYTHLLRGDDPWLKACALFAANISASNELKRLAEEMRSDAEPLVRETAVLVLKIER